jgi:hypothetical protein
MVLLEVTVEEVMTEVASTMGDWVELELTEVAG